MKEPASTGSCADNFRPCGRKGRGNVLKLADELRGPGLLCAHPRERGSLPPMSIRTLVRTEGLPNLGTIAASCTKMLGSNESFTSPTRRKRHPFSIVYMNSERIQSEQLTTFRPDARTPRHTPQESHTVQACLQATTTFKRQSIIVVFLVYSWRRHDTCVVEHGTGSADETNCFFFWQMRSQDVESSTNWPRVAHRSLPVTTRFKSIDEAAGKSDVSRMDNHGVI